MFRPEILAPAGDMEKLHFAIKYGADAVYLSGTLYGMRAATSNFDRDELKLAIEKAHAAGVKVYVTCNTMPRNAELAALPDYLAYLSEIGADAVILADMGVLSLAKRYAPSLPIHISTQTSIVNHEAARMWHDLGADRVVLARELSFEEIAEIRLKTPKELSIEAFVHGSMCMSYSGRCLLSNYLAGRDANRGACAQPCRWKYAVMEERRPGEYIPLEQDESGTFIFNSKDMCMIEYIPELIRCGIDSFKIEGRAKTFYYAAVITSAYRSAVDSYLAAPDNWKLPSYLYDEVCRVSHREYFTGFYFGRQTDSEHRGDSTYIRDWDVCGIVESCDEDGTAVVMQKNRFQTGDSAEILLPDGTVHAFTVGELVSVDERFLTGETIRVAPHPQMKVKLKLPCKAPVDTILRRDSSVAFQ